MPLERGLRGIAGSEGWEQLIKVLHKAVKVVVGPQQKYKLRGFVKQSIAAAQNMTVTSSEMNCPTTLEPAKVNTIVNTDRWKSAEESKVERGRESLFTKVCTKSRFCNQDKSYVQSLSRRC